MEMTLLFRGTEKPPPGDFVLEPYWGGYEKDRMVSAMTDSDLQPIPSAWLKSDSFC